MDYHHPSPQTGRYGRERDYKTMREKREASRETMETVKSFRAIENSIILNPAIMKRLKEIALERSGNAYTYSDTVAFLVNYYHKTQKANQWKGHDHPLVE